MVQALYCPHIGVPTFIIDNSIIAQWLSMASPSSPQQWTDSEDPDTLYAHAVLFFFDAVELAQCSGGARAGQLWG